MLIAMPARLRRELHAGVAESVDASNLELAALRSVRVRIPSPAFSLKYMSKTRDTEGVARPGNKIRIPLKENEALEALLQVKPTKDMPRPGANPSKPKRKRASKQPSPR